VVATNAAGSVTKTITIKINEAPKITSATLETATKAQAYSQTLVATGYPATFTWALAEGSTLPSGLKLSAKGVVSGKPTVSGKHTFTVAATNSVGSVSKKLTIVVQ